MLFPGFPDSLRFCNAIKRHIIIHRSDKSLIDSNLFLICVASDYLRQSLQRFFLLEFLLVVINGLLYFMADVIACLFVINRSHTQSQVFPIADTILFNFAEDSLERNWFLINFRFAL